MYHKKLPLIGMLVLLFSCSNSGETEIVTDPETDPEIETIGIPISDVDYGATDNWAFHPNKATILPYYNLDISVVEKDLQVSETITIANNADTDTGIDVFWVHPTQLSTVQNYSGPQTIAIADQDKISIGLTVIAQGGLLSKYGRVFAPHYRQSTGITYDSSIDKEVQANVIATSYSDIKAAFQDYLENYNNGNKIILAGHSQGSYLLGLLLRDVFDTNESLRAQLVTAALGGMGYVYAKEGEYKGGWWQNIPLCTTTDECGCIHNWASFDEGQDIPNINFGLPEFNPYLINSGLVYREFDESEDWFVSDFSFYGETKSPLLNYIAPDSAYGLGEGNNFIAFNDMFAVKLRREGVQKVVLAIENDPLDDDQRPNDLEDQKDHVNYLKWGYHIKDYHIYLWALMQQIDAKLANCG